MADSKGPTLMIGNKQLAMSKALGAAFLTHQVEQLEKTTGNNGWRRDGGRQTSGRGPGPRSGQRAPSQGGAPGSPPKNTARRKPSGDRAVGDIQIKRRSNDGPTKDADIIVVDASVLVHCLNQVKAWCREGREETLIVPLEALNTLDLLKKGTTPLAQRARGASRILESQVGTNPRVQVQSDAAFVLWDNIPFSEVTPAEKDDANTSPEWVRRTICCARWETDQAERDGKEQDGHKALKKVVLAVAAAPAQAPAMSKTPSQLASPVPLPAPQSTPGNKYEPRATGTLVRSWAARAGIELLPIKPTPLHTEESGNGNDRPNGTASNGGNGPNRSPGRSRRAEHGGPPFGGYRGPANNGAGSLVERPAAVQTMMNMVAKPSGGIRLLARGEKLDP